MPYKIVFTFQMSNGATFNEVYYSAESRAKDSLPKIATMQTRLALLDKTAKFVSARASNVLLLRDTATLTVNLNGLAVGLDSGPLAAGDAAVVTLAGGAGGSRRLWLRGMNDSYHQRDPNTGQDKPPGVFTDKLKAFIQALSDQPYGILRIKQAAGLDAFTPNPISQVDGSTADGVSTIRTSNPILFAANDMVIIARCNPKNVPGINGKWKLINAGNPAGTFKIAYRTPEDQDLHTTGGYVKKLEYLPVAPFDVARSQFHHYGTRTTENPTTHSRGARRALRLRLSR